METLIRRLRRNFEKMESGCWEWSGTRHSAGYGQLKINSKLVLAHRAVYQELVGPIPEGLTIDHLCRNRLCVRPDHLEPVTMRENLLRGVGVTAQCARKTHCPQGHPYAGDNLMVNDKGHRRCRICTKEKNRRAEARRGPRDRSRKKGD